MKRFVLFASAAVMLSLLAFAQPAHAGAIDLIAGDATITELEDDDWETIFKFNTQSSPTQVAEGDVLYGIYEITAIRVPPGGPATSTSVAGSSFTGVFAAKVGAAPTVSTAGSLALAEYSFVPLSDSEWNTVFAGSGITRVSSDTMILMYEDNNLNPPGSPAFFVQPEAAGVDAALQSAVDGTPFIEIGMSGADDEWSAQIFAASGDDPTDITQIRTGMSTYQAALSVTHQYAAASGLIFVELTGAPQPGGTGQNTLPPAQVHLNGFISATGAGPNFLVRTDTDIFIRAVPEPASMTLLAFGLAGMGAVAARRRKQAV